MKAPPRTVSGAVVIVLSLVLGGVAGCDEAGPDIGAGAAQKTDDVQTAIPDPAENEVVPVSPGPCRSQSRGAWATTDRTVHRAAYVSLGDIVVGPRGRATVAWTSGSRTQRGWQVLTSDVSSGRSGGPQALPGPAPDRLPAGARVSALYPLEDHLGADGSGALTAAFRQDLLLASGQTTEYYDLVLTDRAAGGAWSATPTVADDGYIGTTDLAVNASGAAVVAWDEFEGRASRAYVSYRPAAGMPWTQAERIAPNADSVNDVGIDGAGRAVLIYRPRKGKALVVGGSPITGWSQPRPLTFGAATLSVGAGGAAVASYSSGRNAGRHETISMSPSGIWRAPVRQPVARGTSPEPTVAIDGAGRALYVWWEEDGRLMARRSGAAGGWRAPCVLADEAPSPRYFDDVDSQVDVNARGDAVVMWRVKDPAPQLWVRLKPAGQAWTRPVEVTGNSSRLLGEFRAAIGPRGHAAIAWTTGDRRQVHLLRTSSTGPR